MRSLVTEVFQEITEVDSRLWRTLGTLFRNPGRLTLEYLDGRPSYFIQPIKLYLSVSALFFLFGWGLFLEVGGASDVIRQLPVMAMLAADRGVSLELYLARFDVRFAELAGYLRILSVFPAALVIKLLYWRAPRTYVEHLVTALHYFTFDFAFAVLCALAITLASPWLDAGTRAILLNATFLVYLVISFVILKTVYRQGVVLTGIKAVVFMVLQVLLYNGVVILGAMLAILLT